MSGYDKSPDYGGSAFSWKRVIAAVGFLFAFVTVLVLLFS
jgi:hypothetical protein